MTLSEIQTVVANLDDFIELPDGIERLRKAVLALAVAGKLVPQDPKEGTGEELYKKIQAARAKQETTGRKKKEQAYAPVTPDEVPFEIPKSWKWVRLGDVTNYGKAEKCKPGELKPGIWVLELEDLEKDGGRLLSVIRYPERRSLSDKNIFQKGDVLYGKLRPYLNKVLVASEVGVASSELLPIRWYGDGNSEYLRNVLLSDYFSGYVNQRTYGMKMPRLGTEDGQRAPLPLPPLVEQKRIVQKVKEIMAQLDELEARKNERDTTRAQFTRSAMAALGRGESKLSLEHLAELIKTPEDVEELHNAALTLAVSGKLVPQVKQDGVVESEKSAVEFGKEFNIPDSWKWFQLDRVCDFKYGYTDSAKESGGARFVRITDMDGDGNLIEQDQKFVDVSAESEKYLLKKGDILTARIGATFGRTIIFKESYKAIFASYLIRITFDHNLIVPEYYLAFSKSGLYWGQAHALVSGSAQPQFNANLIKKMYIPVPPVAEQKRIVEKVGEVMGLITSLKKIVEEK